MTAAAALQPAQAKAPAAAAAPPSFAPVMDNGAIDVGPSASLARIPVSAPPPQAQPAAGSRIQRKCAGCEREEQELEMTSDVRPRLEVGAADDPFEREADAIAGQVMALRDTDIAAVSADAGAAPASVQRACAACSNASKDDDVRARRVLGDASEDELKSATVRRRSDGVVDRDDEDAPRMRQEQAAHGGETIAASSGELTRGGISLPERTRQFFEMRMGRDLSHVRLHVGTAASALSRSIRARAFTYENHIWLGSGESAAPSFTMAHELAHVLQQTSPGPVGPDNEIRTRRDNGSVRRAPFFLPGSTTSGRINSAMHNAAQRAAREVNANLVTEVAMPGATRLIVDRDRRGFADFYTANEVGGRIPLPGIRQQGDSRTDLENISSTAAERAQGGTVLAPRIDSSTGAITNLANAPVNIQVGELKPAHDESYRAAGARQVQNYIHATQTTVDATNDYMQQRGQNDTWGSSGGQRIAREHESITMPIGWGPRGTATDDYPIRDLKIRDYVTLPAPAGGRRTTRATDRRSGSSHSIRGRWMMAEDSTRRGSGVYVYYLAPRPADVRAVLADANASQTFQRIMLSLARIYEPLTNPPQDTARRVRRRVIAKKRPRVGTVSTLYGTDKVRRRYRDSFNITEWNRLRTGNQAGRADESLRTAFAEEAPESLRERMEQMFAVSEWVREPPVARSDLRIDYPSATNTDITTISRQMRKLRKAAFWSSRKAHHIGRLRVRFGRLFVGAFRKFEDFKRRMRERMRRSSSRRFSGGSRGTIMKAAARVIVKILPKLIRPLLDRMFEALIECGRSGFEEKLRTLVGENVDTERLNEYSEDVQEHIANLQMDAEAFFDNGITQSLREMQEDIEEVFQDTENVLAVARTIKDIAQGLRIASCIAGLISAPETVGIGAVIGCGAALADWILSKFGLSPIEYIVAMTLDSCESQNIIARLISGWSFFQSLPQSAAQLLVGKAKQLMRENIGGTFGGRPLGEHAAELLCDEDQMTVDTPQFREIPCGRGGYRRSESGYDIPEGVAPPYQEDDPVTADERRWMGRELSAAGQRQRRREREAAERETEQAQEQVSGAGEGAAPGDENASGEGSGLTVDVSNIVLSNDEIQGDDTMSVMLYLTGPISAERNYQNETITASLELRRNDGIVLRAANKRFRITSIPGRDGNSTVRGWPTETLTWRFSYTNAEGTRMRVASSMQSDRSRPFAFNIRRPSE